MKKLPSGISDFERLMTENYYYVDKTKYIEKLEDYSNPNLMFLRPRKFGKTLFTSTLENYYDIKKEENFEKVFSETYIGKNPTKLKNSYHILKFNFSGIDTNSIESTLVGFKDSVQLSINSFVLHYGLDFYINDTLSPESLLASVFEAFKYQRPNEKIYVIIDEYDHFANELLGFNVDGFKDLVSKNGKVRKWYEILKKGTESVVDRIFITGVAPITLDGMTSGFNIISDISRDVRFNEMMGFTKEELTEMMRKQELSQEEIDELLPLMKENYDGYKFALKSKEKMYNSNMTLYFLNEYIGIGELPERMVDVNIASDYAKIGRMLNLCNGEKKVEILEKTVAGEGVLTEITQKFNPEIGFGDQEMASMLYYLGYLTIAGEEFGSTKLIIPNKMMREIYSDYFLKIINEQLNFEKNVNYAELLRDVARDGNIENITNLLKEYLTNLSNRDFQRFDEKYVKLMFYLIVMNFKNAYNVKSELEVKRKYPDILLVPRDITKGYYAVIVEFKYLKKQDENKLEEKKEEAKKQIEEYCNLEEIAQIPKLRKYTIVAVNDEIYVDEIMY